MPRWLLRVDEVSRERSGLAFAVLFLTDDAYAALLDRAKTMRALRSESRDVCALTLYASANWYAPPPVGEAIEAMLGDAPSARIDGNPLAEDSTPVRVDDERLVLDEATFVLSCTAPNGSAVTTEGFEIDTAVPVLPAIERRLRAGDHVEWGLHMRDVDGVRTPHLSVGVWFDLAPGEELPQALRDGPSESQRAAVEAALRQLRDAIGRNP